ECRIPRAACARAAGRGTHGTLRDRPAADPRPPRSDHRFRAVREQRRDPHDAGAGRAALLRDAERAQGTRSLRLRACRAAGPREGRAVRRGGQADLRRRPGGGRVRLWAHPHSVEPEVDGRYVLNTGTWLKRLEYVRVRLGRLPGVYVPSYQLNYFELA